MREAASACLSDYAVKVSASCCLTSPLIPISSTQNAVICLYKTGVSTQKQLLIRVSWSKNLAGKCLSIDIVDHLHKSVWIIAFSGKQKATERLSLVGPRLKSPGTSLWLKYNSGPEPNSDFYVAIMVDSELGLLLGETRQVSQTTSMAEFSLVSRTEHLYGNTQYSTRAKFCETGTTHEVLIKCSGSELSVCLNTKEVVQEKRLMWNFRGNWIICVDGLWVDVMWDVFDWLFNGGCGCGVFMFRRRRRRCRGVERKLSVLC